ncbi:MAG: hypothetical protein COW63_05685 [Bacteroidetes bacterium CG18_big_fil_WC_8_21_14_2_50_41_14]|nr:MAG: hypothetical protein COW63_05685 [Bacteroidetes bacterium CG18_big_fil_WC_8_21_14_2_50_41_14]PJB58793.1 MAG: hypothetical protein CO098_06695 [Bacteroidetes bacterium CG_4_9_14_3_um_filter_41_19]
MHLKTSLLILSFFVFVFMITGCDHRERNTTKLNSPNSEQSELQSIESNLRSILSADSLLLMAEYYSTNLEDQFPDTLVATYYQQVGLLLYRKSAFGQASGYFVKSEHYFKKAGRYNKAVGMLSNQAVIQEILGNYQEAINMYLEAATYFLDEDDSISLAKVYTNIAVAYQEMGLNDKSLKYNQMGLTIRQSRRDTLATATNFNNIGVLYDEFFQQPDSALYYYQQAVNIYQKYRVFGKWAFALNNLARMHIEKKNNRLATMELDRAYSLMDSIDNQDGKAKVLRNQGELYFSTLDNQKAVEAFILAFSTFKEVKDKKSMLEVSELLSKVYLTGGNYTKAIEYMKLGNQIKDSLVSIEDKSNIAEMETKYQVKEKNKAIKILELQRELNQRKIRYQIWLIGLLVIISTLIVLVFLFNYNRNKLKQQQLRLELQNYLLQIRKMQSEIIEAKIQEPQPNGIPDFEEFDLTEREKEVLRMIAYGYKNSEIGEKLFVSENTIKTHIKNIYIKLDVKNRVEALKRVKMVQ